MSGISLSGYSSGIDTDTIVAQLMAIERRPLTRLETKNSTREAQLSIYSDIRSKLSTLKTAVDKLNTMREFRMMSISSSDEDDEHFTVSADSTAQAISHNIKVSQLAVAEKEISQGYADTNSEVGSGTFSILVGDEETEITLTAANATLEGMRDAINASGAAVTATIMNDGDATNPYRLVVSSDESGTANAISIDVSSLSGGTAPIFTDGSGGTPGQQAADAIFTFDGVTVTSSSNEIEDVVTGIDLNLKKVDTENTYEITLESNIDDLVEEITGFVDAYNEFMTYIDDKIDSDTMDGDYTATQIRRQLSALIYTSVDSGGAYTALSQIGISTSSTGELTIDEDDLETALEDNFDDVMMLMTAYGSTDNSSVKFVNSSSETENGSYAVNITGIGSSLAGTIGGYATTAIGSNILMGATGTPIEGLMISFSGSTTGSYGNVSYSSGVMQSFSNLIDNYLDSASGVIKNKEDAINRAITYTEDQIARMEERMDKVEARLKTQFTNMETMLSQLQTQSSYLSALGTGSYSLF